MRKYLRIINQIGFFRIATLATKRYLLYELLLIGNRHRLKWCHHLIVVIVLIIFWASSSIVRRTSSEKRHRTHLEKSRHLFIVDIYNIQSFVKWLERAILVRIFLLVLLLLLQLRWSKSGTKVEGLWLARMLMNKPFKYSLIQFAKWRKQKQEFSRDLREQ